ncbi:acetolactate synthase 2 small subunit [Testudinibacter sp. TR-2022]|uniref:acetolactate synthase 2 small subunit n=1 Tax=Testudinibacter sp. TR-2022 TaxID=2585029 RepID=UPI0011199965|nr:acetolactate synthase 2 small subunit [Testudinibacter sp. TR-2022]TNH01983.1 acetolactate synthase 2 small subunit [Pasteurellaceae bacterium Phil31]TNH09935.1 acetolactate synthase 2 small subunit [Testudinibacter sp. TR-2022]TNH14446.1 acetolactate synthase 2 small subunit [Testudinibacter sp. TR-2022]TNH17055.1 acetolactate synthase 2 small subunit [Testudinibacter sp. TR-2022]
MKQYQLTLQAQWRPEVLERVLRVVRHRGYRVSQLQMTSSAEHISLNFSVSSERSIEALVSQLSKLFDVQSVVVL